MTRLLLALCTLTIASAQTVHLRSTPGGYQVVGYDRTTGIISTMDPHGLSVGDTVENFNICANDASRRYISNYRGLGKVAAPITAKTFHMTTLAGGEISEPNDWCDGSSASAVGGAQWGGKVTPFDLNSGLIGFLDGSDGPYLRKLALSTDNGLVSLICGSGSCTATTSYTDTPLPAGRHLTVWGTTNGSGLNNGNANTADYTVTSSTATSFTFAATGVSGASTDYTHNDSCGPSATDPNIIGGTENCVVISQWAISANYPWAHLRSITNAANPASYKHRFDGGTTTSDSGFPLDAYMYAARFLVQRDYQGALDCITYTLTNIQRVSGVNFARHETFPAWQDEFTAATHAFVAIGFIYQLGRQYLTAPQKASVLGKIYNRNKERCNKPIGTFPAPLASGTARNGGDGSHIVLAASDAQADGYYVDDIVRVTKGGVIYAGLITAYTAATKTATISTPDAGLYGTWQAPGATATYEIYPSVRRSGTTLVGHHTHFTTDLSPGDAVLGPTAGTGLAWDYYSTKDQAYVSTSPIVSDTSVTVILDGGTQLSATPVIPIIVRQWAPGDCGYNWYIDYWGGALSNAIEFPPNSGFYSAGDYNHRAVPNGNQVWISAAGHMLADLAAAPDDSRAVEDLERYQSYMWNWPMPWTWMYHTGFGVDNALTYWYHTAIFPVYVETILKNSFAGFPSMNLTGSPALANQALYRMYMIRSDFLDGSAYGLTGRNWPWNYGTNMSQFAIHPGIANHWLLDFHSYFSPASDRAKYLRDFLIRRGIYSAAYMSENTDHVVEEFLFVDPTVATSDYTQQPTQYYFGETDNALCQSLTAATFAFGTCPANVKGGAILSSSAWGDVNRSATNLFIQARAYYNEYDTPEGGSVAIYKVGRLLDHDTRIEGNSDIGKDNSEFGDQIQFGSFSTLKNGGVSGQPAIPQVTRWASANHGSWSSYYGDANSRYMYAMVDVSKMYTTPLTRATREIIHFKKAGSREVIIDRHDVAVSGAPISITTHLHYEQTGEPGNGYGITYPEGTTTCNSCSGANPSGYVYSHQDGAAADANPARTAALMTSFFSPTGVFVRDDGVWSLSNANYNATTGGYGDAGHSHRVSLCAGASCGAAATTFDNITVHEISGDFNVVNTPTASALNPDSNWTGVQTSDKVALFSRGGLLRSSANLTTTHAGTAQYLIAGLQSGMYSVTVGGTPVVTNATVPAGDNSLYFESTAGAVSIVQISQTTCSILTTAFAAGTAGAVYSQQPQTVNCVSPVTWDIAGGSLCSGLSLNSPTGTVSGIPATPQTCSFTLRATDSAANAATGAFSITIVPPPEGARISAGGQWGGAIRR